MGSIAGSGTWPAQVFRGHPGNSKLADRLRHIYSVLTADVRYNLLHNNIWHVSLELLVNVYVATTNFPLQFQLRMGTKIGLPVAALSPMMKMGQSEVAMQRFNNVR